MEETETVKLTVLGNMKALKNTLGSGVSDSNTPLSEKDTLIVEVQVPESAQDNSELPNSSSLPEVIVHKGSNPKRSNKKSLSTLKRDTSNAAALRERCRQLGLSIYFREQAHIRSLGITSSIASEGKS